jgi:hypothetical protein
MDKTNTPPEVSINTINNNNTNNNPNNNNINNNNINNNDNNNPNNNYLNIIQRIPLDNRIRSANKTTGGSKRVKFFDMFRKPKRTRRHKSKRRRTRRCKKSKRRTRR